MGRSVSRPKQSETGFTLIEMMVALAVFSLAALALLKLEGATMASTYELDRRTIAQIVARNLAAEALTDPVVATLGATTGEDVNGGRPWRWTRNARRIGDGRTVRIDISVADAAGQALASLTVVRPAG
jgi:general secretion pathway protein I